MVIGNLGEIKAVAFDIDGTLYKNWQLNFRITGHFLRHIYFFAHYGLARKDLRKISQVDDFSKVQAGFMAKRLNVTAEEAQSLLDKIIYEGLMPYFARITPCRNSLETIKSFKEAGFKIALLSDFPPEQKGELWGFKPYCDLLLGTEACGALKPLPDAFKAMAEKLGVKPEEILYVGNSLKYDVMGSKNVGMKAAWFATKWDYFWKGCPKEPDFVFHNYLKLKEFVLN
ncbi:MAG: HAD family hydrolase [Treponema sp.]|nr:HAD family hydrolase [Treponema sp.]